MDKRLKTKYKNNDIAIVGIGCRFSGGIKSAEQLYEKLLKKECMIVPVPDERKELFGGKSDYCKKAGFLNDDINMFDNKCFGISELEAERMDPSQKLLLMVCREAFEDAGCRIDNLSGSDTGVYIGSCTEEYAPLMFELRRSGLVPSNEDVTGSMQAFLSGKISYAFGLRGPSVTMNTACSSSFVSLHQAILGLKNRDCRIAVAGGVSLMLLSDFTEDFAMLNILSKTCTVRTFDKNADGTVRGEGAAAVVLKRLKDAERDGDSIYAVITASGLNQDGRSSGITAPYGAAQEELIRAVWNKAEVSAEDIDYIETHGTGTKLGDAIEISVLADVTGNTKRNSGIYIGSVKPNIGHTEAVSGLAGLIKTVMSIKHHKILPEINFEEPSEQIDWESSNLEVTTEPIDWIKENNCPRTAAVSAFGLSGTNGHIVLSEYIEEKSEDTNMNHDTDFIKISAASEKGLKNQIAQLMDICKGMNDNDILNFAASQNLIRSDFIYRTYIKASTVSEIILESEDCLIRKHKPVSPKRRIAALFTGQGSQYPAMLKSIYESNSVFRSVFDRCDKVYSKIKGESLADICFSDDERVNNTEYSQPVIFAAEVSLFEVFKSVGITPTLAVGHSIGEYAAACCSGVFGIEDGMRIVIRRGELMNATKNKGTMLAVKSPRATLLPLTEKYGVYIACENSPSQTVLSGEREKLESLCKELENSGIRCTFLNVSNAFHSALMDDITEEFRKAFDGVVFRRPLMKIISNVTGKAAGKEILNADYWVKHIRSEVKFNSGIRSIKNPENYLFLELGSKPVLAALTRKCLDVPVDTVFMDFGKGNDSEVLREAIFRLYSLGAEIDWEKLYENTSFKKIRLPVMEYDLKSVSMLKNFNNSTVDNKVQESVQIRSTEEITDIIMNILKKKLDIDTSAMRVSSNLLTFGVSSVLMLQLSSYIRMYFGVDMTLDELIKNSTVEELVDYLYSAEIKQAESTPKNSKVCRTEHANELFALNKIQEAYFVGRRNEVLYGGTGCYAGFEYDVKELDTALFEQAVRKTAMRHEMLRCIITEDGEQYITEDCNFQLKVYRRKDIADMNVHLKKIHNEIMMQILPLGSPLWDMRVTEIDDETSRIHFGIDFMIADARSLSIFWQDIELFYKGKELKIPDITYFDYLKYTESHFDAKCVEKDEEYWKNRSADFPDAPELPYIEEIPKNLGKRFVRREAHISAEDYADIINKAASCKMTATTVLLELFSEVIASRCQSKHFGIMLTTFRRENINDEINDIMGDFTNLMLTEISIDDSGFIGNAEKIQSQIHKDYAHSRYSAIDFVKYLSSSTGKKHAYPVVFTSTIGVGKSSCGNMFTSNRVSSASSTPQVFIDHQVYEDPNGGLLLAWDTVDSAFPKGFIDDTFEVYINLVKKFCETDIEDFVFSETRSVEDISEQTKANDTYRNIEEQDLLEHFEEVCRTYPDKKAVICGDDSMTYNELLEFVQKTAGILKSKGIKKGSLVTVDMEKSCEQIGAVAGIVYCGAVYVPMSYGQPHARTVSIMERAGSSVIVRMSRDSDFDEFTQISVNDIRSCASIGKKEMVSGNDSAYIIYTSGSTGEPKGVKCTHGSVMNTIMDVIYRNEITSNDVFFGVSSVSFDLSVFDIFSALNTGGTLVIPKETERIEPSAWQSYAEKYGVTVWNSVPSIMELFCGLMLDKGIKNTVMRRVFLSGDWIQVSLPEKIKTAFPNTALISMGGATEASIWSNYFDCKDFNSSYRSVPYGYPLSNQSFYVLDDFGRMCPRYVEGKLHIGGKGLAQGYHNAKDITEKAFFVHETIGERVYDTGDYGMYLSGGIIEFRGRRDHQVKINGYRVELGEIKSAFGKIGISNAEIVPIDEANGSRRLAAFIKDNRGEEKPSEQEIILKLGSVLPGYLIPGSVAYIEEFPLTVNCKLDRKKLIETAKKTATKISAAVENKNDTTEKSNLLEFVRQSTGCMQIGLEQRFDEMGISSMDIIRLAGKLERRYGTKPPIYELMSNYTVKKLDEYYSSLAGKTSDEKFKAETDSADNSDADPIKDIIIKLHAKGTELKTDGIKLKIVSKKPVSDAEKEILVKNKSRITELLVSGYNPKDNEFPLTDVQMAYLIGRDEKLELCGRSAHYYTELEYSGNLNTKHFKEAVDTVVREQDMLRTVILKSGKQIVLGKSEKISIPVNEFTSESELLPIREKWSDYNFELGIFPMFHIELSRFGNKRTIIHFSFDCMLFDGWSTGMMFKQIFDVYNGKKLRKLTHSFRDYAEAEKKKICDKSVIESIASGICEAPNLPYSKKLSEIKNHKTERLFYNMDKDISQEIRNRAESLNATLTVYFLAAYMEHIHKWCGQERFTIDLTLYNRPDSDDDYAEMIGDFTNIAFVTYSGDKYRSFKDTCTDISNQIWKLLEYRDISGIKILSAIPKANRNAALFPVVFTSLAGGSSYDGTMLKDVYSVSQTPQVALDFQLYERDGLLTVAWDYLEEAFEKAAIENSFNNFIKLLLD